MTTPDERREAAQRRIAISSLVSTGVSRRSLGDNYSTLSVKVPHDMATALAVAATEGGLTVSDVVRSYIEVGLKTRKGR